MYGKANRQVPGRRKMKSAFPGPLWNLLSRPKVANPEFTTRLVPPGIGPTASMVPPLPAVPLTSVNLYAVGYDQSSAPSEVRKAFTTPSSEAANTTSLVTDSAAE